MNIKQRRQKRHLTVKKKLSFSDKRPRIAVSKSNKYIQIQLIDDVAHKTILGMSSRKISSKKVTKTEAAKLLAEEFASKLKSSKKEFDGYVFDRGGFRYHGRIKALAEGLREKGLKF